MRNFLKTLLLSAVLWLPVTDIQAQETRPVIHLSQSGCKSLNDAVQQVRRQYPDGRIVNASTKVKKGREVHEVRVMVNGRVKNVKVRGCKRG